MHLGESYETDIFRGIAISILTVSELNLEIINCLAYRVSKPNNALLYIVTKKNTPFVLIFGNCCIHSVALSTKANFYGIHTCSSVKF